MKIKLILCHIALLKEVSDIKDELPKDIIKKLYTNMFKPIKDMQLAWKPGKGAHSLNIFDIFECSRTPEGHEFWRDVNAKC